ncbi:MAG: NAD-dependent DNA ligase LigA [Endomicrobium sp.]|jgi:DNA ligase (NAD+)|nr:NAD-dependent DNA ligase LigA [Endomicrobium sp.]
MKKQKKIDLLMKKIAYHDYLYYNKNTVEISDFEYDSMIKELSYMKIPASYLVSEKSPIKNVSGYVSKDFKKAKHYSKILSLSNTYSKEEIFEWYTKITKKLSVNNLEIIVEPKIDGLNVNLLYIDGILVSGATRGNGVIGENVTNNIINVYGIPHKLIGNNYPVFFELQGEVYIDKLHFKNLNSRISKSNGQIFTNSRNAASGSLRQKNSDIVKERGLSFFVHSLGRIKGQQLNTQMDFLEFCKQNGFRIQKNYKLFNSCCFNNIIDYIDNFGIKIKNSLPYDTDGVVIKINSFILQKILGCTSKSPKWAVAFKFPAVQKTTKVSKIRIQVGRTGLIIPSASLLPVKMAGVTISKATLHNFEEVKRLNINEGDTVLVERSGDVIPKIIKVTKKYNEGFFVVPKYCPICMMTILKQGKHYRCINQKCPTKFKHHLLHFVSKDAMNIKGFGQFVVDQLLTNKRLQILSDIYNLTYKDLIKLELFNKRRVDNLLKEIINSKKQPLENLLFAFGIPHIGKEVSRIIAKKFKNLNILFSTSIDDFISIPTIGKTIAFSLKKFFSNKDTYNLVNNLKSYGVNITED